MRIKREKKRKFGAWRIKKNRDERDIQKQSPKMKKKGADVPEKIEKVSVQFW